MARLACPEPRCFAQVQRTPEGTVQDGLAAHLRIVHGKRLVSAGAPDEVNDEPRGVS